jgi:hypothetical protein
VAERFKAPVLKFACDYPTLRRPIPESPNLSALLKCASVPHPFPSRLMPASSVAIWVAKIALCLHRNLVEFNIRRGRHDTPSSKDFAGNLSSHA